MHSVLKVNRLINGEIMTVCMRVVRICNPPLGRTHIWQTYPESKIKVKTNIGDSKGNNKYLYNEIDWPYGGFK